MTRKAVILNYTKKERQQFEKLVNGAKVERRLHQRAQIILACLEKKDEFTGGWAAEYQ